MSSGFNPYHQWLGIPVHEQPADYYRLLGLDLFESDLAAIETAANRLVKHVHGVATIEQREEAKVVLKELLAAKRCLLVAERKQAYDAGLRAGREATQHAQHTEPPRNISPAAAVHVTPIHPRRRVAAHHHSISVAPARHPLAAATTLGLIGAAVLGFMLLRGDSVPTQKVAAPPDAVVPQPLGTREQVAMNVSEEQAIAVTEGDTPEPDATTIIPEAKEPAAERSLPEFVAQTPPPEPVGDNESPPAEPIDREPPRPDIESEVSLEPQPTEPTTTEHSSLHKIATTAERGGLLREIWNDVTGNKVEEFVQYVAEHPEPTRAETIDRFEPPEDFDDQYGQRLRGYLHPPTTGSYEFSIRANAEGWLYVSTDTTPENQRRVEPGTSIELEAGKAYYVEAFHKESTGRDYLSIGWKLPDGIEEKPIPGERLSVEYRIAPRHESEFVVLTPRLAESSTGTKLEMLEDGVISVTGPSSSAETYSLAFEPELETITALRLEAIPGETLPASGPGRGLGGRFALAELQVTAIGRGEPDAAHSFSFASAADDAGRDLRRVVDGDENTVWRASGRGEQAAVTLVVDDPASLPGGTTLVVGMKQREALGRFRLLATSARNPRSAPHPPAGKGSHGTLYSLQVNLGGDDFTTPDGARWRASKFFDNETFGHEGGRGVSEDLISNKVQGTALRGISAFRAVVPEGTYEVTLYFCEYWSTTPSSRRFAIAAEQRVVVANLDLYQAAGGIAKPLVYPIRNVKVTDGRLDIDFREASDDASTLLNAIRIQQIR